MHRANKARRWVRVGVWAGSAVLSIGLSLFSYRYFLGIGPLGMLDNLFCRPFLYLHIAGAATALLIGVFQFLPGLRRRGLHRHLGRIYVVGCLLGAAAGFVLAFGSYAGPIVTVGLGSLSVSWFVVNLLGWRSARLRRFEEHRAWMIRSWSLTLAAVTLRLYLPLLPILGMSALDAYRATAFLSWIPNLIVAEMWLRRRSRMSARAMPAEHRQVLAFGGRGQA